MVPGAAGRTLGLLGRFVRAIYRVLHGQSMCASGLTGVRRKNRTDTRDTAMEMGDAPWEMAVRKADCVGPMKKLALAGISARLLLCMVRCAYSGGLHVERSKNVPGNKARTRVFSMFKDISTGKPAKNSAYLTSVYVDPPAWIKVAGIRELQHTDNTPVTISELLAHDRPRQTDGHASGPWGIAATTSMSGSTR